VSHPSDGFTTIVHPEVRAYLTGLVAEDDPIVAAMEAFSAERDFPLIGRESGRWLELLTRLIGGRRVFEFGSGFGFSALFFARAVGEGGTVLGTEKDAHELEAHARFFAGHPLRARIDLRPGDAMATFAATPGGFDVVFLDHQKIGYLDAYEAAIPRIRPGGLLLADNTIWGGKVARPPAEGDVDTASLQRFNRRLATDPRLMTSILPTGDGLSVAFKR
jgi:predicted O-methyltransferase YrrM